MKIEGIDSYRDGGSVSIIVSGISEEILIELDLPIKPKYTRGDEKIYEVFRNFSIGSKDKNNYFFGDKNGEYKQIFSDNSILLKIKSLLEEEKIKRGLYNIEKFLISL